MDSTGIPGYTQVTQEVVDSLQGSHLQFRCRGTVKVKGKGDMITYLLVCDQQPGVQNNFLSTNVSNSTSNTTNNNVSNGGGGGAAAVVAHQQQQQQENNVNLNQNINKNYHPHMKLINEPTYATKMESYNFVESPNLNKFKPNCNHYSNRNQETGAETVPAASSSNNFNITENLSHSAHYYNQHPQQQQHQPMNGSDTFNYNNPNIRTTATGVMMEGQHPLPQQSQKGSNYNNFHQKNSTNGNYLMENEPLLGASGPVGAKIVPRGGGNFNNNSNGNNINNAPMYEPPHYATNNNIRASTNQQPNRGMANQQPTQSMPQMPHNLVVNRVAQSSSNNHHNPPPKVMLKTYMKPLPKSPPQSCDMVDEDLDLDEEDLDQRREMSSTDDLSSRPHSPSMSSSDESYSKTTEGEFDEEDQNNGRFNRDKAQEMFRQNQLKNPMQWLYPCDIQVDPTSPGDDQLDGKRRPPRGQLGDTEDDLDDDDDENDLEYDGELDSNTHVNNLRDCEVSSTADSLGPASTAQHTRGESCASFEYQNHFLQQFYRDRMQPGGAISKPETSRAAPPSTGQSPFEREIQRLMMGGGKQPTVAQPGPSMKYESVDPVRKQAQQNFSSITSHKHPVGLEAIKEITRNKNPSDSSQM